MIGRGSPWEQFAHDPRRNPDLRASTADRSTVCDFLAEAYADGRLDREEFEERTDAANAAKTLGQLPPLLSDLAPDVDPQKSALAELDEGIPLTREEIDAAALEHYRSQRRKALLGIVAGPVGICVAIWAHSASSPVVTRSSTPNASSSPSRPAGNSKAPAGHRSPSSGNPILTRTRTPITAPAQTADPARRELRISPRSR